MLRPRMCEAASRIFGLSAHLHKRDTGLYSGRRQWIISLDGRGMSMTAYGGRAYDCAVENIRKLRAASRPIQRSADKTGITWKGSSTQ